MVARRDDRAECGDWRDHAGQCAEPGAGGRGFSRRLLRDLGRAGRRCGISALALAGLLGTVSYAQTADELEDFEDVVVIGQERPSTIGDIDLPQTIAVLGEDGEIDLEALPETVTAPALRSSFADARLAYEGGDYPLALRHAKSAGEGGDMRAQMLAGLILARGTAGARDDDGARRYLEMAAGQGDTDALLLLGEMAVDGRAGMTEMDAQNWFRKAANLGNTQAMRALSTLSQDNAPVAAAWESKAAREGDAEAMRRRAASLMDSDPVAAMGWLEKAAAKGDAKAAYAAAILQIENYDLPPNEAKAARLMRQAAEAGLPAGMADYGLLVYQGAGVARDLPASAQWFRKAAQAGDSEGMFLWAFTLAKGEGVAQDYGEAYYWLLKSGTSGVDDYDAARQQLRERLEANVDPAVLSAARARVK